jgi:hypothetical protein
MELDKVNFIAIANLRCGYNWEIKVHIDNVNYKATLLATQNWGCLQLL